MLSASWIIISYCSLIWRFLLYGLWVNHITQHSISLSVLPHCSLFFSLSLLYLSISTLLNLKEKGDKPCVVCYIVKWIKCDGCPLITSLRRIICWLYIVVNTGSWCQVMKNWLLSANCNSISMQVTCQKSLYTSFYFQRKNCSHPSKKRSPHIHIYTTWQI